MIITIMIAHQHRSIDRPSTRQVGRPGQARLSSKFDDHDYTTHHGRRPRRRWRGVTIIVAGYEETGRRDTVQKQTKWYWNQSGQSYICHCLFTHFAGSSPSFCSSWSTSSGATVFLLLLLMVMEETMRLYRCERADGVYLGGRTIIVLYLTSTRADRQSKQANHDNPMGRL